MTIRGTEGDRLAGQPWSCRSLRLAIHTFGNASAVDRKRGCHRDQAERRPVRRPPARDDRDCRIWTTGSWRGRSVLPPTPGRTRSCTDMFSGIGGVVHTHSPYAVGLGAGRTPVPILGTTHADHLARRYSLHGGDDGCHDPAELRRRDREPHRRRLSRGRRYRGCADGSRGRPRPVRLGCHAPRRRSITA